MSCFNTCTDPESSVCLCSSALLDGLAEAEPVIADTQISLPPPRLMSSERRADMTEKRNLLLDVH